MCSDVSVRKAARQAEALAARGGRGFGGVRPGGPGQPFDGDALIPGMLLMSIPGMLWFMPLIDGIGDGWEGAEAAGDGEVVVGVADGEELLPVSMPPMGELQPVRASAARAMVLRARAARWVATRAEIMINRPRGVVGGCRFEARGR